jgi:hypothetical protein
VTVGRVAHFYGIAPGAQLDLLESEFRALLRAIPVLQAEEAMQGALVSAYGQADQKGREGLWAYWQRMADATIQHATESLRVQFGRVRRAAPWLFGDGR